MSLSIETISATFQTETFTLNRLKGFNRLKHREGHPGENLVRIVQCKNLILHRWYPQAAFH